MTRKRSRAKAPAEALLTGAQRRVVIALSAERMRLFGEMNEVMEALKGVAQDAGMVGEGPFDFEQREEGMFVVVTKREVAPVPAKKGPAKEVPAKEGGEGEL